MSTHPDTGACIASLMTAFPPAAVFVGSDVPARNRRDRSDLPELNPLVVVRPNSASGVAEAVRICARHSVPIVPQGGLTGLVGGASPIADAVVISLERFSGIEEIDPAASTMTVRAGTPLELIQRAADDAGFFIPLDLGSRGSCQIGGNIATNAGGNRVIRYGMAREMVLGLEYVLPDGTLITSLNKMIKNNAGYDLKQLFIGSEGTLGIVTRAVLRMQPRPACVNAALCGVNSYGDVVALLGAARKGLGSMLSAFEVMWPDYWHDATEVVGVRSPLKGNHGLYVLVEAQGISEEIDSPRFQSWIETQFENGLVADAAVSRSIYDVAAFWATREAVGEFRSRIGPHIAFDIGLPVAEMEKFVRSCRERLTSRGVSSVYYGHIGDGNLHIVARLLGAVKQPEKEISASVYTAVREFHGTISAEHGVGLSKKSYLDYSRTPEEIALMRRLKMALDPLGILNPGKVIDL